MASSSTADDEENLASDSVIQMLSTDILVSMLRKVLKDLSYSYFNVFGILIFFICSSFTPVDSKNQKFRWGKHPYF